MSGRPQAVYFFASFLLASLLWQPLLNAQNENWERRDEWQRVDAIFDAMRLTDGSVVADIGAGKGYLTVRMAPKVGEHGRIYAVDLKGSSLRSLKETLPPEFQERVTTVVAAKDDPKLAEESLNAAVILNAYHEMGAYRKILHHIWKALKPGGLLVIVDPISDRFRAKPRARQTESHELALEFGLEDLMRAGYEIVAADSDFTKRQTDGNTMWLLVGRRPLTVAAN